MKTENELAIDGSIESIKHHIENLYKILNENPILGESIRDNVGGIEDNILILEGLLVDNENKKE